MLTSLNVQAESDGIRIDVFLAGVLPGLTRSAVQKLITSGGVTMDGKPLQKSYRTQLGDVYDIVIPQPEEAGIVAQNIPLDIAYEDDDVVVVNKPRGMVVHPAPGHPDGTLVNALLYHCEESLSGVGGVVRPGIVHRIDKDTSGLIIAAKNDAAHLGLAAQLKDHSLARVYECIVIGNLREDSGTVNAPIGRHPVDRQRMAVTEKNSRHAVTHWEVLDRWGNYTHLRCRLETGRTHQIRVHMAHIGHPLLGDMVYGRKKAELGLEGQCLHAKELHFIHPISGTPVTVDSALPDYFAQILRKLGPPQG